MGLRDPRPRTRGPRSHTEPRLGGEIKACSGPLFEILGPRQHAGACKPGGPHETTGENAGHLGAALGDGHCHRVAGRIYIAHRHREIERRAAGARPSYAVRTAVARILHQKMSSLHERCDRIAVVTSTVALGKQRQPPDHSGTGLGETHCESDRASRAADAAGSWHWVKQRLGPLEQPSPTPCERERRKRECLRGLSPTFIVNWRVGAVCNRPGNGRGAAGVVDAA